MKNVRHKLQQKQKTSTQNLKGKSSTIWNLHVFLVSFKTGFHERILGLKNQDVSSGLSVPWHKPTLLSFLLLYDIYYITYVHDFDTTNGI